MFPAKTPVLYVLHMIIVLAITFGVLFVTKNPLALFGLMFMPQVPLVAPQPDMTDATGGMGFLANLDED